MARDFKNYDVFISSPSDVSLERDTVQEAIELVNKIRGSKEGFRLSAVRWETDVSSQFGDSPQSIINTQNGEDYDIFVGVLCNRFGQPTEAYESGTEEEFFRAYERLVGGVNSPEILFYFKDPRKSETPIDANQFLKVAEFKKQIGSLGVYSDFDSHESLKTMVVSALSKAIDRLKMNATATLDGGAADVPEPLQNATASTQLVQISDFDEDIGLMELTEIVLDALETLTDTLDVITTATGKLGAKIEFRTNEIRNFRPTGDRRQDQKNLKAIIEKVATEMHRYSHAVDDSTPNARREFSSALQAMQHAIIISNQDGLSAPEDVKILVNELISLREILNDSHEKTLGFYGEVSSMPRMTSKLNQAKRRTLKSISDLLGFLSDASVNIDTTLKAVS